MTKRSFFKHVMAAVATVAIAPSLAFRTKLDLDKGLWLPVQSQGQVWQIMIGIDDGKASELRTFLVKEWDAHSNPIEADLKLLHVTRYDLTTDPPTITGKEVHCEKL